MMYLIGEVKMAGAETYRPEDHIYRRSEVYVTALHMIDRLGLIYLIGIRMLICIVSSLHIVT